MIEVEIREDVRIVHWDDGDNRFNGPSIARWHEVLDDLEQIEGPLGVVVVGTGRYFSNGLDLEWFGEHPDEVEAVIDGVHRLFGRLLTFPAYTVAAINGHAFAGGAMLTCACDARIMRADRGFWCIPEVDLGFPLTDAMHAVLAVRLPRPVQFDAVVTGRRYSGTNAEHHGIVDDCLHESEVLHRAVERAQEIAVKNRSVIAAHKQHLYGAAAAVCGWPLS